ncbi:MAG: S1C family serine protease, partial [Rubripirellula sp.]
MDHDPQKPDDSFPSEMNGTDSESDSPSAHKHRMEDEVHFETVSEDNRETADAVTASSEAVAGGSDHGGPLGSELIAVNGPLLPTRFAEGGEDPDHERVNRTATKRKRKQRRPDPITQSLMLLATMTLMLAAARFVVPRVVEEIRYAWYRGELRAEYESGTEGLRNVSLDALSEAYQMVTSAVGPSVVHIDIQQRPAIAGAGALQLRSKSMFQGSDQGSGIVVDQEGYILTNRHVILDGEDINVTLSDGRRVAAVVVGADALTDLALLKVDAEGLMPIAWGDSDRCRVGSPVWAVGSPFGLDRTVTFGILSGKHRKIRASTQYQDFMQSDVAVNPGNSGGPLVD